MASNTEFVETGTIQYEYIKYNGETVFLGSGAFGRVYAAVDTRSHVNIAVKEVEEIDNKNVKKLHEEIKLHSKLKHENITKYLASVSENGIFKIFMEYVPGGSLYKLIMTAWGSLENDECIVSCFSKQILEGLKYLHNRRIVHRDIKGENVLVDTNNWVLKITDFGISKQLATIHPRARTSTGSYRYMAPEVINVEGGGYETRADIWSFGCTMVVMVTRKHPFPEFDNEYAVLYKVGQGKIHPVFPESISEDAKTFLLKCFEPDPDKRATAEQLLEHPFIKKRCFEPDPDKRATAEQLLEHPFIKKRCFEPDPDKRATAEQLLEHPFIKKRCFEPDPDKRATAEQLLEHPFIKKQEKVYVSRTRLDTAATTSETSASLSKVKGEHDNLKSHSDQCRLNFTDFSGQMDYLKNQTEDEHSENSSYPSLLNKEITNYNVHTSGIQVTDRGHQNSLSQPSYANASILYSVNDMSPSQSGSWNSSSQITDMTDTYVKTDTNINPSHYSGSNLPIQSFQEAVTLMSSSQAGGLGNSSFQNTVPAQKNPFAMKDTQVTKDLPVIPISYSGNSLSKTVQHPQTLMSQTINVTMAMQTNGSHSCLTPQNQMSASKCKCLENEFRVEDDQYDPSVTELSVTSDGRIIIVDIRNRKVKMLSQDREKISSLNVNEDVRDVTVYNDTSAVVTGNYKLFFINISGSELPAPKSIRTRFSPWGIQTCNENFLVTCYDCDVIKDVKLIKIIKKDAVVMWSVSKDQEGRRLFSVPQHITCFQDGNQCIVVVSDAAEDTLTLLDGNSGKMIKVCELTYKEPSGVTSDNRGNIYVGYYNSDEIAIWDKDMKDSRILIQTTGRPRALSFDASKNQLIVSYYMKYSVEIFQLK